MNLEDERHHYIHLLGLLHQYDEIDDMIQDYLNEEEGQKEKDNGKSIYKRN